MPTARPSFFGTDAPPRRPRAVRNALQPRARPQHSHAAASGFSLVEFLLVSVPVLLLTLGGIELAHWFHVRQMVGLALVEAARAGATQHAQPAAIAQAFEHALRPLFAGSTAQAADARLVLALRQRSRAMDGAAPWQIRILRPDARDYARFAAPALAIAQRSGLPAIRNDYQYEQQQRRGYGGHASGDADATVFAANTLALRLTYPHPPLLPGVARLIASLPVHTDAYARRALAAGLLPMTREVRLDMASHPVDWPSLPDGRVIKGAAPDTADDGSIPGSVACAGLWCQPQARQPLPQPPAPEQTDAIDRLPPWEPGLGSGDGRDGGSVWDTPPDDAQCP